MGRKKLFKSGHPAAFIFSMNRFCHKKTGKLQKMLYTRVTFSDKRRDVENAHDDRRNAHAGPSLELLY